MFPSWSILPAKLVARRVRPTRIHRYSDSPPDVDDYITTYPESGTHAVDKVRHEGDRVWINSKQYFGGVSEAVWEFAIGAYKPAQKWLEQRKKRNLTSDELDHYQRIIKVLSETVELMDEIDEVPASWAEDD